MRILIFLTDIFLNPRSLIRGSLIGVELIDGHGRRSPLVTRPDRPQSDSNYMCGCSPVCKSFFDTFRARRIVRTCVRTLYATHLGRGPLWCTWLRVQISPKNSLWSAVGTWFSRSRPYDRLTHKWSGTPRHSPRTRAPSANYVPDRVVRRGRPASTGFLSSFCPRRLRERSRLIRLRA